MVFLLQMLRSRVVKLTSCVYTETIILCNLGTRRQVALFTSIPKNDCQLLIVYFQVPLRLFPRLRASALCGDVTTLNLEREHGLFS